MSVFADLDNILRACPAEYLAEEYGPDATVESIAERLVEGIRAVALECKALGEFIGCSATRCAQGEWSSKAEGRGWVRRGDGWLCVQCADAAEERAEIVARIDAGTWGAPALSYRAQQLLAHVHDDPGTRWQTGRAEQVYAGLGYPKRGRRHNARTDLNILAARGLLTAHGPADGRYFLLAQPKDGA
ncbi:hypothetical protein JI76_18350 [Streptomyces anulatus]|uniref:hypothetical protein n=1 Tax=Streptomyces anulatus TaxID=1892 RepID=UPI0006DA9F36|nr:hypothetical protein [Streptomyces anulatus]KPL31158.1 hypothetical protein JI76_18350 [Streptomyces anulatus]